MPKATKYNNSTENWQKKYGMNTLEYKSNPIFHRNSPGAMSLGEYAAKKDRTIEDDQEDAKKDMDAAKVQNSKAFQNGKMKAYNDLGVTTKPCRKCGTPVPDSRVLSLCDNCIAKSK
jgi:hypothetical protein